MKKILLMALALCSLLVLCSCSGETEDDFHFDLINKYSIEKQGNYYIEVLGDAVVEDFGIKYGAELYDIEPSADEELIYYYKYDGETAKQRGYNEMQSYNYYLENNPDFTYRPDLKGFWYYQINGTEYYIKVTYADIHNPQGLLVAIAIPTKGIVGEHDKSEKDDSANVIVPSGTTSSETGN